MLYGFSEKCLGVLAQTRDMSTEGRIEFVNTKLQEVLVGLWAATIQGDSSVPRLPEVIHHYTSVEGLFGIVHHSDVSTMSTPTIRLRMSEVAVLNDMSEVRHGAKFIPNLFACAWNGLSVSDAFRVGGIANPLASILRPPDMLLDTASCYVFSTSMPEDEPTLWQIYGRSGKGCSLGISTERVLCASGSYLVPAIYEDDSKHKLAHMLVNLIGKCAENDGPLRTWQEKILTLGCLMMKPSGFMHEKEVRIVSTSDAESSPEEYIFRNESIQQVRWLDVSTDEQHIVAVKALKRKPDPMRQRFPPGRIGLHSVTIGQSVPAQSQANIKRLITRFQPHTYWSLSSVGLQ